MLKLTLCEPDYPAGSNFLYIFPRSILALQFRDKYTEIWISIRSFTVQETPEQIMAMPEMVYEMYPAMMVAGATGPVGSANRAFVVR